MHFSPHLVIAVLAGSAWAIPFATDGKNGTWWPSTRLSTSISTILTSSASTSAPASNSTESSHHYNSASVNYNYPTTTEILTKTTFIPCSIPVATFAGTTYYSTYLTTSIWTSTSCYPLSTPQPIPAPSTTTVPQPPAVTHPVSKECPTGVATVTVVETIAGPTQGGYWYPPSQCQSCQTITYTDVWGNIVTIAIQNPATPTSTAHTVSITGVANNTQNWTHHASGTAISSNRATGKWTLTASTSGKPTSSISSYSFLPTSSTTALQSSSINSSTSDTKSTSISSNHAGHSTTSSSSTVTVTKSSSTSITSAPGTGNVKPSEWIRL